jgi:hypothetical protein
VKHILVCSAIEFTLLLSSLDIFAQLSLTLLVASGTTLTGTMGYFLKHGRTQLLQILRLKEHLGIMILVMNIFYLLPLANMVFILASLSINLSFPVDVVEIGERRANVGDVLKVKPLAALAMIDEGELDWKIVAISLDDPKASLVNDVDDVEKHFPV